MDPYPPRQPPWSPAAARGAGGRHRAPRQSLGGRLAGRRPTVAPPAADPAAAHGEPTPGVLRIYTRSLALLWASAPRYVVTAFVLLLVSGIGAGLRVLFAKLLIDRLIDPASRTFGNLLPLLVALGTLIVVIEFAITIRPHIMRMIEGSLMRHTQERIFDVSARAGYAWFDQPRFYQLLERAQSGTQTKTQAMVQGVEGLLDGLVGLIALLAVLVAIDPLLAAVVVVAYVPSLLTSLRSGRNYYELAQSLTEGDRRRRYLTTLLADRDAAKEIRANASDGYLRHQLSALWDQRLRELSAVVRSRIGASFVSALGSGTVTLGAAILVVYGVTSGRLTVAAAAAAVLVLWEAGTNLQVLSWSIGQLRETGLFVTDYETFLSSGFAERTGPRPLPGEAAPPTIRRVEVRGARFRYPGGNEDALRGVDLTLERGSIVALVGLSGAGKTTLVKLLCGFYQPQHGAVLWDGRDARTLDPAALREQVAVIFQDYVRYAFSARLNIGLGAPDRPPHDAAVVPAALGAGAHDFLSRLPGGYETVLSTEYDGVDLSGGQWQRVALARALFRDSPVLILDEPTSALDPQSERVVIDTIRERCRDKAVLLISHRLSAVSMCDKAYVLADGRVVESGRHDELIERGGVYSELYRTRTRRAG